MQAERGASQDDAFLLDFFKALAEPVRMRLAGRLVAAPATLPELSSALGMPVRACLKHLRRLIDLGLVRQNGVGSAAVYCFDDAWLRRRSEAVLDSPRSRALAGATDDHSRTLATFFRDGRLLKIPTGDQRKIVILAEVARRFAPERAYTEREVNLILKEVYAYDYTTLRRLLVDYTFLNRSQGVYWLGEGWRDDGGPVSADVPS